MLEVKRTTSFKKEYALMEKRGWDMDRINTVMKLLVNEQPLPARCRRRPLHGEWAGCTDCHVLNDNWVLIYEIDKAANTVTFHRTGTHADLF